MSAHLPVAHEALHVLDSVASPSRLNTRFQLHVQAAPSARCIRFHSYSPCTPIWASALLMPTPAVGAGLHHPHLGLSSSDADAPCRGRRGWPSITPTWASALLTPTPAVGAGGGGGGIHLTLTCFLACICSWA